ncbi:MAG: hypothetical protein WCP12_13830 [bacterium]
MNFQRRRRLACGGWCLAFGLTMSVFGRDPFFPLGYEVKNVTRLVGESQLTNSVVRVEKAHKGVTSDDWHAARQLLQVNGFASSGNKQIVLISGKSYRVGEKLRVTNQGIIFVWRVELPEERKLNLVPLEAVRE